MLDTWKVIYNLTFTKQTNKQQQQHTHTPEFYLFIYLFIYLFLKIYLFICKYTVAVFRHSRRGSQISLRMVVSHHVVAGIWTPDLRKSSLEEQLGALTHWAISLAPIFIFLMKWEKSTLEKHLALRGDAVAPD
jgi:glucan phosphoethanolaminetransferase (alkaline phosphatase superfamily)